MDYLKNYPEKKIERNIAPWLFVLIDSLESAILFSFQMNYTKIGFIEDHTVQHVS